MNRYVVLYLAPKTVAAKFAQATPEQAQQGLQQWIKWGERLGPQLLHPGRPLGNARTITPTSITASDTQVIGMSIIQAPSMDDALELVKDHHHLAWDDNCRIEILEEVPIPELSGQ